MSWLQQLGGLLQQYAGGGAGQSPHDDFSRFAQAAPQDELARGIAHAFRSDQTPPFQNMVGQLFGQADPDQRAGLLNTLIGAAGPALLQRGLGGNLGNLAGLLGGGHVSPQQAAQIRPEEVDSLAGYAEQQNPGIVDQLGGFFAQNPGLFGTLGAGALSTVLGGMAQRGQEGYAGGVRPASQDPYGDPADGYGQQVLDASQDPYGDPADMTGQGVLPSSQDPYGDPADRRW